jgi:hypothetical protein
MDQAGRVVRAATALLPVRRSNRHRWGASTVVTSARQRLTFLNRTLFAGVPIPPLEIEIAA